MGRVFIGTSGWSYRSWKGDFYPTNLSSRGFLKFYANRFDTTEINSSFYHLPRQQTYERWKAEVPNRFVFSVKASRVITHVKRLSDAKNLWDTFVYHAQVLGSHLGPILLQFPESFRVDLPTLSRFLQQARGSVSTGLQLRLVVEFRHLSWFTDAVYALLRRHHVALCIADSPRHPRRNVVTADFAYLRFHGRDELFVSSYSNEALAAEANGIRRHLHRGLDVYVYFNNDAKGHAVPNAQTLRRMIAEQNP
ncbi:hypothetical protein YTPLAS18_34130 [Nitrospira sp.]|nr:hypothetical protein YTPLAS18_34130 [Nitrospira sp.]